MASKSLFALALSAAAVSAQTLSFAGVNIAGFDFGCSTDGTCNANSVCPPLTQLGSGCGADGLGQMQHFVKDDGYNLFRLPVGWQYLTYNQMTGVLDETYFANYNLLVNACLGTGASCVIDIHNYARYNGAIIGQGGPSNELFAELWGNIAGYWKNESRIIFGLMNEPHDIPDITMWAETVQAAVTAIRSAGATSQMILLPGTDYASAQTFVSSGSAAALDAVTNPDGTITNLVMDVHKYLDSDSSGTNTECVTNNTENCWSPLSTWLRENKRQALNTETGGGNVESCVDYLLQQVSYQAANSDVILGYVGWAGGAFATSYVLSETPSYDGSSWTDTLTVSKALSPNTNKLLSSAATARCRRGLALGDPIA